MLAAEPGADNRGHRKMLLQFDEVFMSFRWNVTNPFQIVKKNLSLRERPRNSRDRFGTHKD
jgi:hypothetical protein